jgi:hypothetical protein
MSSSSKAATRRAVERLAELLTSPQQRRAFARIVSAGPDELSIGKGGHRRTPTEVSQDLWGVEATIALYPAPKGSGATAIFKANLELFLEEDERTVAKLGREAFGSDQGRKKIRRALNVGWPRPDVADGLVEALGIELADLFVEGPESPGLPAGFYIDDQSGEGAEIFVGCHDDGWCGPERDAICDAEADCRSEAKRRSEAKLAG